MGPAQADQPDISGLAIEQYDHICVFNRGDQDSGSIQCRVTSWMEAP
jgi:hypothetical protein